MQIGDKGPHEPLCTRTFGGKPFWRHEIDKNSEFKLQTEKNRIKIIEVLKNKLFTGRILEY